MYYVYILYSLKTNRYYIGSCEDIASRLAHHNKGLTPPTRSGAPDWKVKYTEVHPNRSSALKRERLLKSKKSREYLEWVISSNPIGSLMY